MFEINSNVLRVLKEYERHNLYKETAFKEADERHTQKLNSPVFAEN